MKIKKRLLIFFSPLLLWFCNTGLFAFGPGFRFPDVFLPVGLNLSYQQGFQIGAEVSLVHLSDPEWIGVYGDLIYNAADQKWQGSVGPELGFAYFGLDGGLLFKDNDRGFTVRALFSFIWIHAYFRLNFLPGQKASPEFGTLFKFSLTVE